ncbi:MAG TPA: response regulator transcription factor [Terriglobia bacterium]|nr:response regulator transcription factor [Terriglobia bacterium]
MRVLIADDQPVFRKGVMETVARAFSLVTFGEAGTAEEALEHVRRQNWEVIILDAGIPGGGGLDILNELKRLRPQSPILLLSRHANQFAGQAIDVRAVGYLSKDCLPEELNDAIKNVVGGEQYVSPTLATKSSLARAPGSHLPAAELLSGREFQVLRMIASGKTITAIAKELSLSVKTVSTYRARILEKTGMKTNAALIRFALQAHLVD